MTAIAIPDEPIDQDFFNAQKFKGSINQFLKQASVTLEKYIRVEVGQ